MHRELSHVDEALYPPSNSGLYAFTGLLGLLMGLEFCWPLLARTLGPWLGIDLPELTEGVNLWGLRVTFALHAAALLGGARILYGSLENLANGKIGADVALALAVVAAILIGQPLVAAEVVLIGLLGECLEAFTFARTQRAIRKLVEVCPRWCLVLRDGQEIKTRVEDVRHGERVLIRPGKRVSVDGVVVEGQSSVDQSALTGESLPIEKAPGADVFAGTLNQHGALVVEVRRIAEHTVMGQVVELTARALKDKAPLERTADRLARYFLPIVLAIALVTLLGHWWWLGGTREALRQAIFPALAVLVVACPCALILATPAAIIAALGRLAGTGVLVRGGAAIERLAKVDTIAFDKTGALTQGKLQLGDVIPLATSEVELLRLAASAEQRSEHLLAQLVVRAAQERHLELATPEAFTAHPGGGVAARVAGSAILVGNRRFLEEQGVTLSPEAMAALERLDNTGQTTLLVARDGQLLGVLGARDAIRPEASVLVEELRRVPMRRMAILTGDRAAVATEIAQRLDIPEVAAELLPAQKAQWIQDRRSEGRVVAMVGDGINDAPALAVADAGIALGGVGADVAAEAGDFVLLGEPLRPLPLLIRLSRKTVEIIRQNILVFAFGVNALGILLTAWLLPAWSERLREQSPLWAAIYHQIGSIAVLLNSMRLLAFERSNDWSVLRNASSLSERIDGWLRRADFHDFTHWVADHGKAVTTGVVAAGVVLYLLTGLSRIGPDQIGLVRRFGQVLPIDLQPGLHYRLPWPWEQVTKAQPARLRSVDVGFRGLGPRSDSLTWTSAHGEGIVRQEEEALMMTGDGSLVEVQARVFYLMDDPRQYVFAARDPELILRSLAEAALREVVAERPFIQLLSDQREQVQQRLLARLRGRLSDGYALGISLESVALQDLHPPQDVVDSYYAVTRALSTKERLVAEAERDRETAISLENVSRTRQQAQSQSQLFATTERSKAERDAFLALVGAERGPWLRGFRVPMPGTPLDTAVVLLFLENQSPPGYLAQELTEFRLQIDAAEQVLSGRPKVLRDPALPGQLHVIPEFLKWRIPPPVRESPRGPSRRPGNDDGP